MSGAFIPLKSGDGFTFQAFHVAPVGPRKGGLIVIQEIFGVNSDIQDIARDFAGRGFEVLAPSMYDRVVPGFALSHDGADIAYAVQIAQKNGVDNALRDIATCVAHLGPRGNVFITGYCYGGSMAYAAACKVPGLAAASCYYGSQVPSLGGESPKCPAIAHFGREDPYIPLEKVQAFAAQRPDVPVHLYDAGHGFNSKDGGAYHEASAALALDRTLALFAAQV
jgi:carboxymethylenebutenolidase